MAAAGAGMATLTVGPHADEQQGANVVRPATAWGEPDWAPPARVA